MYVLIIAAVIATFSLLLAWWTEADVHDDSFDLAQVLACTREPKEQAGRSSGRIARVWDWWWGNSSS